MTRGRQFVGCPSLTVPQGLGPIVVKMSGGGSSGMLLASLLEGGQLRPERGDFVIFNNTSAEHPVVYDFVRRLRAVTTGRFGVPFFCTGYRTYEHETAGGVISRRPTYQLETPDDWRVRGETFEEVLAKKRYLPTVFSRTCTVEMKIIPTEKFIRDRFAGLDPLPRQGKGGPPRWDPRTAFPEYQAKGGVSPYDEFVRMHAFLNGCPTFRPEQRLSDYAGAGAGVAVIEGEVDSYVSVIGFRADEPKRIARMRARSSAHDDCVFVAPLMEAGLKRADVDRWWAEQDEAVRPHYRPGMNISNCTYCFLKQGHLVDLHRHQAEWESTLPDHLRAACSEWGPHRIEWWMDVEARYGRALHDYKKPLGFFPIKSAMSYERVITLAREPGLGLEFPAIECMGCTD